MVHIELGFHLDEDEGVKFCHYIESFQYLDYGPIPNDWKIAQFTPVYKGKGNKCLQVNSRPISIISPISKVFETVMGKAVTLIRNYLENRCSNAVILMERLQNK